jgi:hypothetical protein
MVETEDSAVAIRPADSTFRSSHPSPLAANEVETEANDFAGNLLLYPLHGDAAFRR